MKSFFEFQGQSCTFLCDQDVCFSLSLWILYFYWPDLDVVDNKFILLASVALLPNSSVPKSSIIVQKILKTHQWDILAGRFLHQHKHTLSYVFLIQTSISLTSFYLTKSCCLCRTVFPDNKIPVSLERWEFSNWNEPRLSMITPSKLFFFFFLPWNTHFCKWLYIIMYSSKCNTDPSHD